MGSWLRVETPGTSTCFSRGDKRKGEHFPTPGGARILGPGEKTRAPTHSSSVTM